MSELQPLRDDLPEPLAALAAGMRDLFNALETSLTRFSVRMYVDRSNVSRYLSGHAVPPWRFVHQLVVEATLAQSGLEEVSPDAVERFYELHRKAQVADDSQTGHITRLRDQLAAADVKVSRAQRDERRIEGELAMTRRQIGDTGRLTQELELVRESRREAERECDYLESEIDAAERRGFIDRDQQWRSRVDQSTTYVERLHQFNSMRSAGELLEMGIDEAARKVYEMSPYDAAVALRFVDPYLRAQILQRVPEAYRGMISSRLRGD